jgi:hypothetical protein
MLVLHKHQLNNCSLIDSNAKHFQRKQNKIRHTFEKGVMKLIFVRKAIMFKRSEK